MTFRFTFAYKVIDLLHRMVQIKQKLAQKVGFCELNFSSQKGTRDDLEMLRVMWKSPLIIPPR